MGVKHTIQHDLGRELAIKVTAKALETYRDNFSEYEPRGRWVREDRAEVAFTAAGRTLTGAVEVRERVIELELTVPFLFRPFKAIAIGVIDQEIRTWINRAKAGELDSEED